LLKLGPGHGFPDDGDLNVDESEPDRWHAVGLVTTRTYESTASALERIVERCSADGDRAGFFAAMYLAVTRTVRQRSDDGAFEDPARMERFISSFAARYLDAHDAWRGGQPTTEAWKVAFDATTAWRPIILQHLLLGMNAHINLDLGVCASDLAEPGAIDAVRVDFDAVNDVLAELVDGCQNALGEVSPWLGLVDRIGRAHDEAVIRFSLLAARRQAWKVAVRLSSLSGAARDEAIAEVDAAAASVGRRVRHPGVAASALLLLVRLRERAEPGDVMRRLAAVVPAP
jgi:hypothetical protein